MAWQTGRNAGGVSRDAERVAGCYVRVQTDDATVEALCLRLEQLLPSLSPQQLAGACASLARLQSPHHHHHHHARAPAAAPACATAGPAGAAGPQRQAAAAAEPPPPVAGVLRALRLRCEALLPEMRLRDACNAALGLARLAAAVHQHTGDASAAAALAGAQGAAARRQDAGGDADGGGGALLPAVAQLLRSRLGAATLRDLVQAVEAFATVRRSSPSLFGAARVCVRSHASVLVASCPSLTQPCLCCCAVRMWPLPQVDYHPGREWLQAHEAHVRRLLLSAPAPAQAGGNGGAGAAAHPAHPAGQPGYASELRPLLLAYEALGHTPARLHHVLEASRAAAAAAAAAQQQQQQQQQWQGNAWPPHHVAARPPHGQVDGSVGRGAEAGSPGAEAAAEGSPGVASRRQQARRRLHQSLWRDSPPPPGPVQR